MVSDDPPGRHRRAFTLMALLRAPLARQARRFLYADGLPHMDFVAPEGEPALVPSDSISWRVFKNPVTLFIGGIAAVVLELAEPRVRSGVWNHTTFRTDPVRRLRRTALAAMMTVYGARSRAEAMIAGVRRMHERVSGVTPEGAPYRATDPELLDWVHATASFGFLEAYRAYARPLEDGAAARYYAEGRAAAELYGATGAPASETELEALFARMAPTLETSPIIFEFLRIMRRAAVLPTGARPAQGMLIRAGIETLPAWVRECLGLEAGWRLAVWERKLVTAAARLADRMPLEGTPPLDACRRLGLAEDYLFADRNHGAYRHG
ncbi:MAG: oxygenase MpaB family protein [Rhodomicrobiaceae bacterium]